MLNLLDSNPGEHKVAPAAKMNQETNASNQQTMQKAWIFLALAGLVVVCVGYQQTRTNTKKIEALSQKIVLLQQSQATQLQTVQSQLTSIAPMLTQTNSYYFAKSYEKALFFHTNTLYLLLTIGEKIDDQLEILDKERQAEAAVLDRRHSYLTNEIIFSTAEIKNEMAGLEQRIQEAINLETKQIGTSLGDLNGAQTKASAMAKDTIAQQVKMEAALTQIQRDLNLLKARLGFTNQLQE